MQDVRKGSEMGMTDREKVIKGLECHTGLCSESCPYYNITDYCFEELCRDALELLKMQEDRIGTLTRAIEQMPKPTKLLDVFGDGYAKVVRCMDCKWYSPEMSWCNNLNSPKEQTFYCADGKRR